MKKSELISLISDALTAKAKAARVKVDDGQITIMCSSFVMEVKAFSPCEFPDMDAVVDAMLFWNAVRYMVGDEIKLQAHQEHGKTIGIDICSDGNKATVLCLEEQVLERKSENSYDRVAIPEFDSMVSQVAHCVESNAEPGRASIYIGITPMHGGKENGITVMAFTGPTMAIRKSSKYAAASAQPQRTIAVYGKELQAACRLIREDVTTLYIPPKADYVKFVDEHHEISVSTVGCNPPAAHKLLSIPTIIAAKADKEPLGSALSLCEAFGEYRVELDFESDLITLNTSATTGAASTRLPCEVKGLKEPLRVKLDTRKAGAAVKSLPGKTVKIQVRDATHPIFLYGEDGCSVEIIMPLSL